jgi:hypothetical protein
LLNLRGNVAYNAICLLHELVQGLHTEDIWLDRLCIVSDKHLVEYGRDVHRGVAVRDRFELAGEMTMLPAGIA